MARTRPARVSERVRVVGVGDGATAPVLIIHGKDDAGARLDQAKAMEKALKDAAKWVTLVERAGEDHWLSRSETRIAVLLALEPFLAVHLST